MDTHINFTKLWTLTHTSHSCTQSRTHIIRVAIFLVNLLIFDNKHTAIFMDTHTDLTFPAHTHAVGVFIWAARAVLDQPQHVDLVSGLRGLAMQVAALLSCTTHTHTRYNTWFTSIASRTEPHRNIVLRHRALIVPSFTSIFHVFLQFECVCNVTISDSITEQAVMGIWIYTM